MEGLGWTVKGNFWAHDYKITSHSRIIASISKRWFSWGDTYEIDISDDADEVMAICVVLIIDAVIAQSESIAAASSN